MSTDAPIQPHVRGPAPSSRTEPWGWLLALVGPAAVWAATVWLAGMASSPELPEGQCGGIGWGCTLSPRDAIELYGMMAAVVVVPVLTLVLLAVAAIARHRALPRVAAGLAIFAGLATCLALAASAAAG
jgi:hypothetical protein